MAECGREGHRISFEGTKDGCDWMTALSHDRLFVALLSEMGQMPQELERDGLQYKVIESGVDGLGGKPF